MAEQRKPTLRNLRTEHIPMPGTNSDSDFGSMWQACSCGWNKPGYVAWDEDPDQDDDWWSHIPHEVVP